MKKILDNLMRFLTARGGNVATVFALALVPISVMGGGAVDFAQAMNARGRLAEALDAAALAVGSQTNLSVRDAEALAMSYITANYPADEIGNVHSVTVSLDDENGIVTVTGQSRIDTTLLAIMGMEYINVDWTSEVQRAQQNLELVMVLDNTGSMRGSKIASLRDSAELLTDILYTGAQEDDDVRIGLVPFAATVNVGRTFQRVWWLDPNAESPLHAQWAGGAQEVRTCRGRGRRRTCTTETVTPNTWDMFDSLRNERWDGCVEARAVPLDIEDVAPARNDPETLFLPFFAPDEPDISNFRNSYLRDGVGGGILQRLADLSKYNNGRPRNGGPNDGCTTTPVTPMTSDRRSVENAISAMGASGNTNIPNGIAWGIRLLSPQEPFTEGVAYGDRSTIKAMVILTDGQNVLSGHNSSLMSRYNAYGYIAHGRLGVRTSSSRRLSQALDERTAAACAYAREQGIRVYTITFQVSDSGTRDMMRECASHPSLYFDSPSNAALRNTFEVIAGDLSNLRISR
ncbi:pilus assembly protein TadG-related protein [Hyphobacterium sp.]|jgi:Flp pilus assembly protein TadG|uniref:TadE/TadG family type IV pilus assembly protein n=1 Tax=Hyphobacterium sp. TaxID=2004662 RepID=UPI003BA841A1